MPRGLVNIAAQAKNSPHCPLLDSVRMYTVGS